MNPFSVKTPETLKAEDIASLFIDVFSDFPKLLHMEHTFLHGARGTGKSMMLRYLEPSVQLAAKKASKASELEYFAVHIPIKSANYSLSELERLDGAPYWLIAEHFLILNSVIQILNSLINIFQIEDLNSDENIQQFYLDITNLAEGSLMIVNSEYVSENPADYLKSLLDTFIKERRETRHYLARLAFTKELVPYTGAFLEYQEFFLPFVRKVIALDFSPIGPIYLMLDDADNLPVRMQKVINGWVSYRTTNDVCLKISTQQKYQTWRTTSDLLIQSSHDFSEIDISSVYTSRNYSLYYDRVEQVVRRRLEVANKKNTDPLDFFPLNETQETALASIKTKIGKNWEKGNRVSSRKSDDVRRYAVSEYLKLLAKSKKSNTYSYSGFRSMVDISSGMIRYFLEPAARMYAEIEAIEPSKEISGIPSEIQDMVLYRWSEEYFTHVFDRLTQDETNNDEKTVTKVGQLRNLLVAFGECFQIKLLSSDSERQFISFMITQPASEPLKGVLELAIKWGYLNTKTIARKEGIGRNILYVLNRRLAPYFKLDPGGYAAHLSVTPELLTTALSDPRAFVRSRLKLGDDINGENRNIQHSLEL